MRWYGGEQSAHGQVVRLAPDGGYIIGGCRNYGMWVLRVNSLGDSLWAFGAATGEDATGVMPTDDGSWLVSGAYWSEPGIYGVFSAKINDAGDTLWSRLFFDPGLHMGVHAMAGAPDGGYLVVGVVCDTNQPSYLGDGYAARFDRDGNHLWSRKYVGLGDDEFWSVVRPEQGGFLLAGNTFADTFTGYQWAWLVRIDDNGDTLWTRTYRPDSISYSGYEDIVQTSDGGYVAAGGLSTDTSAADYYLEKMDSMGRLQWSRTYGGPASDCALAVCITPDRGYLLVGQCSSYGAGWYDAWLVKTDSNGNVQWSRTFGGPQWDQANDIEPTPDGGYIVAGQTFSFGGGPDNVYLIKTDSSGLACLNEVSVRRDDRKGNSIFLRLAPSVQTGPWLTVNYSVPEAGSVEVALYDIGGRKLAVLASGNRTAGQHQEVLSLPEGKGIAYVRVTMPSGSATAKLIMTGP